MRLTKKPKKNQKNSASGCEGEATFGIGDSDAGSIGVVPKRARSCRAVYSDGGATGRSFRPRGVGVCAPGVDRSTRGFPVAGFGAAEIGE